MHWVIPICLGILLGTYADVCGVYVQNQIQLEIKINDHHNEKIESVIFEEKEISLSPFNMFRPRADLKLQLYPGSYIVHWAVIKETNRRNRFEKLEFKKLIVIERTDCQVHMTIQGQNFTLY